MEEERKASLTSLRRHRARVLYGIVQWKEDDEKKKGSESFAHQKREGEGKVYVRQ